VFVPIHWKGEKHKKFESAKSPLEIGQPT